MNIKNAAHFQLTLSPLCSLSTVITGTSTHGLLSLSLQGLRPLSALEYCSSSGLRAGAICILSGRSCSQSVPASSASLASQLFRAALASILRGSAMILSTVLSVFPLLGVLL